jgi:hypothetical protein
LSCCSQWNSNDYATGGLDLHFCLNSTTNSCGCEGPSSPNSTSCVPLVDHHDGTYSGVIDGRTVGARGRASFRFFQRVYERSPNGALAEIVIGMWADGSACQGGTPDAEFQSRGGNCFKDIAFVPDCSAHGPGAKAGEFAYMPRPGEVLDTPSCICGGGYEVATIGNSWQCNVPLQPVLQPCSHSPWWLWHLCVVCTLVTSTSVAFAVWAVRRTFKFQAASALYENLRL